MREITIRGEKVIPANPGQKPDFAWIKIRDILVDDDYQRPLLKSNWGMIRKIAANFSWARFSALVVAPTPDGKFALIDGQHRAHAALLCGIADVPCMIVDLDKGQQASAFSWLNGSTTKISLFHVYKAAIAAGEDWAIRCRNAVAAGDCLLMTSNSSTKHKKVGEIFAIALVRDLVEKGQAEAVATALLALRMIDGGTRVALYSDIILRPWMHAVTRSGAGREDARHLAQVLRSIDPFRVIDRIDQMRKAGEYKDRPVAELRRTAFQNMIAEQIRKVAA